MPTVHQTGKPVRHVKNLRWLQDHANDIAVMHYVHLLDIPGVERLAGNQPDGVLIAFLGDGRRFITSWADTQLAWKWLNAKRFRGITCVFRDVPVSLGHNPTLHAPGGTDGN